MSNITSVSARFAPWNNPLDIVSYKDYLMTLFIMNVVVKPVIIVVGVPTNIISCVVFWRQGLGDRMNVCLLALSLVDLCLLLVSVVYCVGFCLGHIDPLEFGGLYDSLLSCLPGVNHGFRAASGCITMVISVERCLCVVFPLKAAALISSRTMAVIMVCIVSVTQAAFFTIPASFVIIKINNSSSRFAISVSDTYVKNLAFFNVLQNVIMMNVLPLTTFLGTGLSTGLTVVKLRAAMTWRGQVSCSSEKGQGQHRALTKMLVVVCCIYIVTTIPWVIFYVATLVVEDFSFTGRYYNFFWTSAVIANHFSYIYSSLSFYVYITRSSRFKKDVSILFSWSSTSSKRAENQKLFLQTLE